MRHPIREKTAMLCGSVALVLSSKVSLGANLLINGGFENPADNSGQSTDTTATGWGFYGGMVRSDAENNTPGGKWSAGEQTDLGYGGIFQTYNGPATAGITYTLNCDYFFESAFPNQVGEVSDLAMTFLNSSGVAVGPRDSNGFSAATYIPSQSVTTTGAWLPYTVSGVAPVGATQIVVSFAYAGGSDVGGNQGAYVDDADLEASQVYYLWNGGDGDWNYYLNWARSAVPNGAGVLAQFAGGTSPQTVYTDVPVTLGQMWFQGPNETVIAGAGSLTFTSTPSALIQVASGVAELDLPVTLASDTTFSTSPSGTLVIANPLTLNSGVILTQTGNIVYQSIVNIESGAGIVFGESAYVSQISLAEGSSVSVGGSGAVLTVNQLTNGGIVNVQNNKLLIDWGKVIGSTDPVGAIRGELTSGYAGGAWNGAGINSSVAAVTRGYSVGYADGADSVVAGLGSGQIEVMYTLAGDANLDGVVNGTDFAILAGNFGKSVGAWDEGDFNYEGIVNGSDFAELAANFGKATSGAAIALPASEWAALDAFAAQHGLLADVPEPGGAVVAGMLAVGVLRRRLRWR
jgi:hypothetical protein